MKIKFLTASWDFRGKINGVLIFGNAQTPLGQFFGHLTMDVIMGSAERHPNLVGICLAIQKFRRQIDSFLPHADI